MARFISPNSADAGSSNFAAIVVFALIMTIGRRGGLTRCWRLDFRCDQVGFAIFASRWTALSLASAGNGFSVFAIVDLTFCCRGVGAE